MQIARSLVAGILQCLLPALIGLLATNVHANDDGKWGDAVVVDYGTGNDTRLTQVNLQWNWSASWFESNGTHISGYWDASLAVWNARAWHGVDGRDQTVTDIGFTPVFRFENSSRRGWFLDGGIGPNLLSKLYENHQRDFSTAVQFGDLVAIGYQSERWVAGFTIEHFSNGAIKKPNPGANFAFCGIGYRFN